MAPQSTLLLAGDERRGVELYLERGRAHFEVAPRVQRPPFVVRAGAVRVTVVGTAFTVARDGEEAIAVGESPLGVTLGEVTLSFTRRSP